MNLKRASAGSPLFFLILIFSALICPVYADELVISTNKFSYGPGATINVDGALTLGGNPVTDGLVAVQVEDSFGDLKYIRVVPTGTPPSPWKARLVEFLSCDSQGNPRSSFNRGTLAYFVVTVESLDPILERPVTIALNLFDSVGVSTGVTYASFSLGSGERFTFFTSMSIPNDAFTGPAICTVGVLTKWPKEEGYPYCPEGLAEFTIIDGGSQATSLPPELTSTGSGGLFSLSFKLPSVAELGKYSVYASARYNAWANTTFDYFWLLTDLDRNGEVNIRDITMVGMLFGCELGDPNWNPEVDLDDNNVIDIRDITKVAMDFGKTRT